MLAKEVCFLQILERKLEFAKKEESNSNNGDPNYTTGQTMAYKELLDDSVNMQEQEFICKYVGIAKKVGYKLENLDYEYLNDIEKAKEDELCGYNNTIVDVLALMVPEYGLGFE